MRLLQVFSLCAVFLFIFTPLEGSAHEARPLYVEVAEQADSTFVIHWRVPPVVSEHNDPLVTLAMCNAAGPARRMNGPRGIVGTRRFHCSEELRFVTLEVTYPQNNPAVSTLVRINWASGETRSVLGGPEERLITLPDRETTSGIARDYTLLGVKHILTGYDHLLFIACLIMIAGTARCILLAVTGFTLAHSITLALAALGLVRVPVAAVEAAIALSIVFLALEIVNGRRNTLAWRHPILVAAAFGLLHGFGFAAVVTEIGLPQTEVPAALLYFNVGVEFGQITFVATLVTMFAIMRWAGLFVRSQGGVASMPVQLRMPVAYFSGSLASFWMISRIAEF